MPAETGFQRLVSRNPSLLRTFSVIGSCAGSGRPLLIVGEAGTGRRLLARALAEELGLTRPVVETEARDLDFPALQRSEAGAMLHVRNAADLPRVTQEELLLALTHSHASLPPLVFSSLADLPLRISSGELLADLYYRLAACEVRLPPLRERDGDLPVLIEYFSRRITEALEKPRLRTDVGFLDRLGEYPFPGNVAELETIMHKAVFWARDDRLSEDTARATLENHAITTIAMQLVDRRHAPLTQLLFPSRLPTIAAAKKQLIMEALRRTEGNQSQAARVLGLTPPAINKFLNRLETTD